MSKHLFQDNSYFCKRGLLNAEKCLLFILIDEEKNLLSLLKEPPLCRTIPLLTGESLLSAVEGRSFAEDGVLFCREGLLLVEGGLFGAGGGLTDTEGRLHFQET